MKKLLCATLPVALLLSAASVADTKISPIKPKIVGGGEVASEGAWPWMSALVYTYQEITTSLSVDNITYESQSFTFSPAGDVSGELIDCDMGKSTCSDATDKVCLIKRGDINFSEKADNCEAGGGKGVIIYNNEEGEISGTLGDGFSGTIPVVAVTQADGATLKTKLGLVAAINVTSESLSQSSSCGASFLGDKWVLTASHCVDDQQASSIKINVGEYDLSNGAENAIAVKRIYMHSDYDDVAIDNDVALLELVESVDNASVSLVDVAATDQFAIDNRTVTVMGWGGRVGYDAGEGPTSDFPDVLHQVDLQLMTNEQCQGLLGGGYDISNAMLCAAFSGGGKGSCQGDSGGPLVINTNEGWQQIGIVSWGVGCAADGYPGVYTRAATFIDWINQIKAGVAIEQNHDFNIAPKNVMQSYQLTVVNNSDNQANLTFEVVGDDVFTLASENCLTLNSGAECLLTVNYSAEQVGSHSASILINSDNTELALSSAKVSGKTIELSSVVSTQLATDDAVMQWYSGGNASWGANASDNSIQSGIIDHLEESIVMLTLNGEGELSFEWAVSSEENTDEPESPFDALYLYVDDIVINFISGEVDFTEKTIELGAGEHKISWVYKKDPAASEFEDKGYLKNVVFTPVEGTSTTTPEVVLPSNPNARTSSGGSMAWLSFILILLVNIRRR